jgi:hypothetical protein
MIDTIDSQDYVISDPGYQEKYTYSETAGPA